MIFSLWQIAQMKGADLIYYQVLKLKGLLICTVPCIACLSRLELAELGM